MPSLTMRTLPLLRQLSKRCMTRVSTACVFKSNSPRHHLAVVIAVIAAQGTEDPHLAISASNAIRPVTGPETAQRDAVAVTVVTVHKLKAAASNAMSVVIVHASAVANPADVADQVVATTRVAATDLAVAAIHTVVEVVMIAGVANVVTIDAAPAEATLLCSAVAVMAKMNVGEVEAHVSREAAPRPPVGT